MATVARLRPRAKEEFTSSLGMVIFLASWAMMFSALFFAYAFVRSRSITWPPPGISRLPVGIPALNTLVLLGSSAALVRALAQLERGRRAALSRWVAATIALGGAFVFGQWWVWRSVAASGLTIRSGGMYGSVFYALTAFHALHVVVGLCVLLWMFFQSLRGKYTEHNFQSIRLLAMFWHFVDVVWLLMFVSIYLL